MYPSYVHIVSSNCTTNISVLLSLLKLALKLHFGRRVTLSTSRLNRDKILHIHHVIVHIFYIRCS